MNLYLSTFASRHFRNLEGSPFELHPRFNLFYGDNGQGKTNLLEAIYFLLTLRPLRPSLRMKELLAWGEQESVVKGKVLGRVEREISVEFSRRKKQLKLNGAPPLGLDDYFEGLHIVAFAPEEIQLARGAPELRRRFLDRAIFNTDLTHLHQVRRFLRVLSHRNALLRKESVDETFLEVINEQFVEYGTSLILRRISMLARLKEHVQPVYQSIFSDNSWEIDLLYHSKLGLQSLGKKVLEKEADEVEAAIADKFRNQLERHKQREIERRCSLVGPHLDDIHFTFQGKPFKHAASQGQLRALILALKIAEISEIRKRTGQHPILLLDDVAGELDPRHSAFFFDFLEQTQGQILLSTTSLDYIQLPDITRYPCFHVSNGQLSQKGDVG